MGTDCKNLLLSIFNVNGEVRKEDWEFLRDDNWRINIQWPHYGGFLMGMAWPTL
jgi:hypothetical protein